jgi:hypothetical protein
VPIRYDDCDKYRWTHRPKEFKIKWNASPQGRTSYPFRKMRVADYFVITDPVRRKMVHNALYRIQRQRKALSEPFQFTVRPVEGAPDVYICRRVE